MRRSSRGSILAASGMVSLLSLLLTGCIGGPQRPDPTEVVTEYLTAIATGDASTATALDAAAVEEQHGGSTAEEVGDFDTLRTDAVLQGAEALITDVTVEPRAAEVDGDADVRRVRFTYELDGQEQDASLQVRWDESESAWVLTQSLTLSMSVDAVQSKVSLEPAPFRLGGVDEVFAADPESAPMLYLVYPGVYHVTADIPRELLARGAESAQTVVAEMPGDAFVQFDVVELPSH
ncbi:hypothetical protein [Microbacterium sp.]|uniref:hypothetical protein n=1 Tax=Microbacterium sp. TaxID=51671 RepID=UPI003F969AB6